METKEHSNGYACTDCLMFLANGETPPELDENKTEEWVEGLAERGMTTYSPTLGRVYGEEGCEHDGTETTEDHALECEQVTFSWAPCDVCGSTLGGAREAVTFWTEP